MRSRDALTSMPPLMSSVFSSKMPHLDAALLPPFEPGNWETTAHAFEFAPCCELHQAWSRTPDYNFQSATVRVGVRHNENNGNTLWVYACLNDLEIRNFATRRNQRTWEMGDVFEIFLMAHGADCYFEFHVTPENQVLECKIPWPRPESEPFLPIEYSILQSWTKIEAQDWQVLAAIPLHKMDAPDVRQWKFSFSRYDATLGREPALSSSSPHKVVNFHCCEEWGELILPI